MSENERILKNAKSAKATNFFYQKAKINNSGFMKTRFKKAFHDQNCKTSKWSKILKVNIKRHGNGILLLKLL